MDEKFETQASALSSVDHGILTPLVRSALGNETVEVVDWSYEQLHGGMGMTDELPLGHYVKRLAAIDILFGDSAHQRAQFAALREDAVPASFAQPRKAWKQI